MKNFSLLSLANGSRIAAITAALALTPTCLPAQTEQPSEPQVETPADAKPAPPEVKHVEWPHDVAAAQKQAKEEGKDILLFFTGSDWCAYCIKLEKAVLTQPGTEEKIREYYIPVVLDFPRKAEMPEEIKAQNDQLKSKIGVPGFPTICLVDADLMPYGKIVGYREPDAFWTAFDENVMTGAEIDHLKNGQSIASIEDIKQLNQILAKLPDDILKGSWMDVINLTIEKSKGVDDEICSTWTAKVEVFEKQIADEKFMSDLSRKYMTLRTLEPEEAMEFFTTTETEQADRPDRLALIKTLNARYLMETKKYDEALVIVDEVLSSESASNREKAMMHGIKTQIERSKENAGKDTVGVPMIRMGS